MSDETIETPATVSLNAEGFKNKPVCPVCQAYLKNAEKDYEYRRTNTDTRWFYCSSCKGHLGYHRMKKRWTVDPYDLNTSATFREFFNLDALKSNNN